MNGGCSFGHRPISLWLTAGMYFVYFLVSVRSNKIYVGLTSKNPTLRVEEHNIGSNSWTRANRPFELIFYESYICKEDARRRELFYKTGIGKRIKKAIVLEIMKKR